MVCYGNKWIDGIGGRLRFRWRYGKSAFPAQPLQDMSDKSIPPHCHFERSEKSSLHSALSCSFRKSFPLFRYHTYGAIPVCKKDRGLRSGWRCVNGVFQTYPLYATWNKPIPPIPSFRAQREIFLALCSFLLLSQKFSPFPLSHIRRYTGVQERSRASLGMTLREWRFPNISVVRYVK